MRLVAALVAAAPLAIYGACPPAYVPGPNSHPLSTYTSDRAQCTAKCNAEGYCCTKDAGGCYNVPCTTGCHVAWFSDDLSACKSECERANSIAECKYSWRYAEIAAAGLSPSWPQTGVYKCAGSEECGCSSSADPPWGAANDCAASACAAGCDLAYEVNTRSLFFRGADVVIDNAIGRDTDVLLAAAAALTGHAERTATLSGMEIASHAATFSSHAEVLEVELTVLEAALDLVDAFEDSADGPLFKNGAFKRVDNTGVDGKPSYHTPENDPPRMR